jgi:hypothetical protein
MRNTMKIVFEEWTFYQSGSAGQPYLTLRIYLSLNWDMYAAEGRQVETESTTYPNPDDLAEPAKEGLARDQITMAKASMRTVYVRTFDFHDPCEGLAACASRGQNPLY